MRYALVLILVCTIDVVAQNIYNSPYSVYGLGTINNRMSTLNRGMSGTGIAVRDHFNLNFVNPASYGAIASPVTSVFEMGFYINHNKYTTDELNESMTRGGLSNINYWFKFSKRWASTLGLSPFSTVSYKIHTTRTLGSIADVNYLYEGNGTISQLYWGHGFTIMKNLSLGFNISYLFGPVFKRESINTTDHVSTLIFENRINANNFKLDAGLQYEIPLRKGKSIVVGIVGDNGVTLGARQKNYLIDGSLDTLATSTGDELKYEVPSSVGVGLSFQTKRSIVAGDLKFENWRDINSENQDADFEDVWKFSMGYMYKGDPDAMNYVGAVSLRAGFHLQNYYLRIKNTDLPWWGFSAGISLPMFDNRSSVNITYSFDQFGTINKGLLLQHSQQIMFDVVIRDLWGARRKFD